MSSTAERENQATREYLETLLVKIGGAVALWHDGINGLWKDGINEGDAQTFSTMLQDINLAAWRIRWELSEPTAETEGEATE